jgi:SAM-dependent methyltransferase
MLEALDSFAEEFISYAAEDPAAEALDIGCAFGVATHAALAAGARICACDMEQQHVQAVEDNTPPEQKPRLRTVVGVLPDVDFPDESFRAILASRVIHFLDGDGITRTLIKMYRWLRPGGRVFLIADTPYMPGWDDIVPSYEKAKAEGDAWPGMIADFSKYSRNNAKGEGPKFVNTLDPDILARECAKAGFEVERSSFFGLQRLGDDSCGKEHAGCAARKV